MRRLRKQQTPEERAAMDRLITAKEETGDLDATPGTRPWAIAVRRLAHNALLDERSKAKHLGNLLALIREHKGFSVLTDGQGEPFVSFEAFCQTPRPFGLGYEAQVIERIIEERKSAEARAQRAISVSGHGGARKAGQGTASTLTRGRGGNPDYRVGRISRDAPAVLEQMQAGAFTTIAAAERAANLARPDRRVWLPASVEKAAEIIEQRFGRDFARDLAAALEEVASDG
jgi:hypothetical protein